MAKIDRFGFHLDFEYEGSKTHDVTLQVQHDRKNKRSWLLYKCDGEVIALFSSEAARVWEGSSSGGLTDDAAEVLMVAFMRHIDGKVVQ